MVWWRGRTLGVGTRRRVCTRRSRPAEKAGHILPIRFDAVDLPLGFREAQAISLTRWRGDHPIPSVGALVDVSQRLASMRSTIEPITDRLKSRAVRVVGGGAAAVVTIAGIGAWHLLKPSSSVAMLTYATEEDGFSKCQAPIPAIVTTAAAPPPTTVRREI